MENWSELKTVWSLFEAVSSETTLLPLFQRTLVIFHSMFSAEAVRLYTYEDARWSVVSYPLEKTEQERPASPPEVVGEEALKTQVSEERLVVRTEDVCLLIEGPSTERVTPETLDVVRSTVVKIAPVQELFRALWEAQRARRQTEERLRKQTVELRGLLRTRTGMIGTHPKMLRVLEGLERASSTKLPILITGETGTGKEAAARLVHRLSGRRAPLVVVDCGAVPASLLESELFGYEKGAFTGAQSNKPGRVELADGGTLFLDEIGELKPELQAKLLHLLQEKTFCPVGGSGQREADVRFIAATNRNLEEESRKGTFRQDLYFRLNVIGLNIPPLRERPDDVPILIDHFRRIGEDHETSPTFSERSLKLLTAYDWPGNIRELENLMARLAVIHPNAVIEPEQLTDRIRASNKAVPSASAPVTITTIGSSGDQISGIPSLADLEDGTSLSEAVKSYERSLIADALQQTKNNRSQAAKLLRMKRTTLIEKLKKMEPECKPS